jgi:hypothetical protein
MLDEYQRLVDANEKLKECKEIASSGHSTTELQEWLNKEAPNSLLGQRNLFTTIKDFNRDDMIKFLLPEAGMSTVEVGNELTGP